VWKTNLPFVYISNSRTPPHSAGCPKRTVFIDGVSSVLHLKKKKKSTGKVHCYFSRHIFQTPSLPSPFYISVVILFTADTRLC